MEEKKPKKYIEVNEIKEAVCELASLLGSFISLAKDKKYPKDRLAEVEKKVIDKFKQIQSVLLILALILPLTSFSGPPTLYFHLKQGDPAPISGRLLSDPEFKMFKKYEICCEEYLSRGEEIVMLAEKPKESITSNPYFWGTTIGAGVLLTIILTWTVARNHYVK